MDALERIDQFVKENPILIFMKGTPQFPTCGFSSRTAEAMKACGVPFGYVNVMADPGIMQALPSYRDWPTFPQVYVNGELIGGADITIEMYERGELKPLFEQTAAQAETQSDAQTDQD
ncbi:MAG TPA: Grx4 family monothiol glutaredoxin [Guyparkeria sp.]|nr:Grx4 family monothiol glutaredoxin [Guyparkeria sp.]